MSVGLPVYKEDYDNKWGGLALQANQLVNAINIAKIQLDTISVANLQVLASRIGASGYTSNDGNVLKSAALDLYNWAQTFAGSAYITPASGAGLGAVVANNGNNFGHDFTPFVKQIYGLGG